jgi:hypothetical protein
VEKFVLKTCGLALDVTDLTYEDRNAVIQELLSSCEVTVDAFNHPSDNRSYITVSAIIPEHAEIVESGEALKCITVAEVNYIDVDC